MVTTLGNLKIDGFNHLEMILDFSFIQCVNEHPRAHLRAVIKDNAPLKSFQAKTQDELVHIFSIHKNGNRKIFTGYLDTLSILKSGDGYHELDISLVGTSVKLDQEKMNRSFQKVSSTHEDIMKKATEEQSARIMWRTTTAESIGMPLIQYKETNWEFILRMASHYHSSVVVDEKSERPVLEIGLSRKDSSKEITTYDYNVGISPRFY